MSMRKNWYTLGLVTVLVAAGLCLAENSTRAQVTPPFKVVVNANNPETSMSKAKLSTLFLKRATRWSDGSKVEPVEPVEKSPVRRSFSQEVHGRDLSWIEGYWNKMIFSGRGLPPLTAPSDDEVLAFVRDNPSAIGYVSAEARIGSGVKVVDLVNGNGGD